MFKLNKSVFLVKKGIIGSLLVDVDTMMMISSPSSSLSVCV